MLQCFFSRRTPEGSQFEKHMSRGVLDGDIGIPGLEKHRC